MEKCRLDFIHVGVPRSGSTWLFECLDEHPDIFVAPGKDLFFWNAKAASGKEDVDRYKNLGLDWYCQQFDGAKKDQKVGEVATRYFMDPEAPSRIKKEFPEAKIIVTLRNPTSRFVSGYKKNFYKYSLPSIKKMLQENTDSILLDGHYDKPLKKIYETFNQDQVLVLIFEEIHQNPIDEFRKVMDFIGVQSEYIPQTLTKKVNASSNEVSYDKALSSFSSIRNNNFYRSTVKPAIYKAGLHKLLVPMVRSMSRRVDTTIEITDEEMSAIDSVYKDSVKRFETILGREVGSWH